ncbi:MAG: hypothetical protein N3E41_05790 [Thermofilaceae archaeon]|nr:hypothetical protein [Thermofilaceae archaeon]
MIVEVDGKPVKLGWAEMAALLVLSCVEWGSLTLSDLELVVGGHARAKRLASSLRELGLVEEYRTRGTRLYTLTEFGEKVSRRVKMRAIEAGLWRVVEEALGGVDGEDRRA